MSAGEELIARDKRFQVGRLIYFLIFGLTLTVTIIAGIRDSARAGSTSIIVVPLGMAVLFFFMRRGAPWAKGLLTFWFAVLIIGGTVTFFKFIGQRDAWSYSSPAMFSLRLTLAFMFCALALWKSSSLDSYIKFSASHRPNAAPPPTYKVTGGEKDGGL